MWSMRTSSELSIVVDRDDAQELDAGKALECVIENLDAERTVRLAVRTLAHQWDRLAEPGFDIRRYRRKGQDHPVLHVYLSPEQWTHAKEH